MIEGAIGGRHRTVAISAPMAIVREATLSAERNLVVRICIAGLRIKVRCWGHLLLKQKVDYAVVMV